MLFRSYIIKQKNFYKKILKELKGDFTIKDLKVVVNKYMPIGYWGQIEYFQKTKKICIPNCSRKQFDVWVLKQKPNTKFVLTFFLFLEKKAKQNVLFIEPLNFIDRKKIEKNLKIFLTKFKGNYTKRFLEKEINLFMPYVWYYDNFSFLYSYNYHKYILEPEPFNLNKKEFKTWIIKQIRILYKNNNFIKEYEIYNQFFLAFIKRANFEIQNNVIDRKSTRLNSSHSGESRMPSSA